MSAQPWMAGVSAGLQHDFIESLGRRIAQRDLDTGQFLSTEALQAEYGVSRTVVREGVKTLESLGMVVTRHRLGIEISPSLRWRLLDPRVIEWRSEGPDADKQLDELLTLRRIVEPAACRLAARLCTPETAQSLSDLCDEMSRAVRERSRARFMSADTRYHQLILEATSSEILGQFTLTIQAALRARYVGSRSLFGEETQTATDMHRRLAQALAANDGDEAEAISAELIGDTAREVLGDDAEAPAAGRRRRVSARATSSSRP